MRATFLLTASLAMAAATPAFAQIPVSNTTIVTGQTTVPVEIGSSAAVTTRIVEPVTDSFDALITAPIEYDENGVAKAQYFKASDLTPEQNKAFQDEVKRVRAYQSHNTGNAEIPNYTYSEAAPIIATDETAVPFNNGAYEIELYAPQNSGSQMPDAQVNVVNEPLVQSAAATHIVVKGDTLYNISKRYDVTIGQLQDENGLSDTNLNLGQSLKIPSTTPIALNTTIAQPIFVSAPVRDGAVTRRVVQPISTHNRPVSRYAVLKKDTLYSIAKRTCVSVNDLALQNGITDPSSLQLGQKLTLPQGHCLTN